MDKLRIGVFLNEEYTPQSGGGFSYYQRIIEKLDLFDFDAKIEVCFLSNKELDSHNLNKKVFEIPKAKFNKRYWNVNQRYLFALFSFSLLRYFTIHQKIKNSIGKKVTIDTINYLKQNKIDLIYYPTPEFQPINYPFIATHWDLGHKSMFAFPEVSLNKRFEKRENYHSIALQKAFAIFAESDQSRKELVAYERINKDRIFVVPMFAGKVVDLNVNNGAQQLILDKWKLSKRQFYFYPAQFWAHKNHYGLIMAFKIILEKHPNFKLVLSGSDKGNLDYIKEVIENNHLENNVVFTGFVSEEEIYTFYKNTIALVMPTYLGPTNMPLLEAYYLGCPVLCSNLIGHQEQMGNKAIYFDANNTNDIAIKMTYVINVEDKATIMDETAIGKIINQHCLSLYTIRKSFGYNF